MHKAIKSVVVVLVAAVMILSAIPKEVSAAESAKIPASFRAAGYTYNSIRLTWKPAPGASGYKLYRASKKRGNYKAIKTLPAAAATFTNKKLKPRRTYYYKLRSYKTVGVKTCYSGYTAVSSAKGMVAKPGNFSVSATTVSDRAKLNWKKVPAVSSYRIYRASSKNGKYKLIKTLSKSKTEYYDKSRKKGAVYYYRIKAVKKAGKKSYNSAYTSKKSVCVKNKIMGNSSVTAEQLAAYYERKKGEYPSYYASNGKDSSAETLDKFCQIYVSECRAEGVRADVAFCQAMKETGWLTFKGDVKISQFNFAGIGATGKGKRGCSFPTVREGVRAHVQHLKAYASKSALNNSCADPRFGHVKRGCAAYVEWLGIRENPKGKGWAASRNYGYDLMKMIRNV